MTRLDPDPRSDGDIRSIRDSGENSFAFEKRSGPVLYMSWMAWGKFEGTKSHSCDIGSIGLHYVSQASMIFFTPLLPETLVLLCSRRIAQTRIDSNLQGSINRSPVALKDLHCCFGLPRSDTFLSRLLRLGFDYDCDACACPKCYLGASLEA